jgi:hypothetical protein
MISASKFTERVTTVGNAVQHSSKERCNTNALCGTEDDVLWDISGLDCPDLKSNFEEYVDWSVRRCTIGEGS